MAFHRSHPAAVHQSDSVCLARLHVEMTRPQPPGHFATVGDLAHRAIERLCIEQAEHEGVDPMSVLREVIMGALGSEDVTQDVVGDLVSIMANAFTSPDLTLGLPPSPWEVVPEWRWALDEEFRPIPRCDACGGIISQSPPCRACGNVGWKSPPAYEGTIDRIEVDRAGGRLVFWDWKSTIVRESSDELGQDKQFRWYATAILAHFPDAASVVGRKALLRHGYATRHEFKRDGQWHEVTKARMRAARAKRLNAIATQEWMYLPGVDCDFCPILFSCPELAARRAKGSDPGGTLTEQAQTLLGLRAQLKVIEGRLRAHVAATEEPIPLEDGDGSAIGMKPTRGWLMARSYERTMNELEALGMTAAQREEWFRFVTEANLPSRVKKALEELVGRKHARGLLEADGWLDEIVEHEFGVWTPPEPEAEAVSAPATAQDVEDAIAKAMAEDPERVRRVAAGLT